MSSAARRAQLAPVVDAAQRVAAALAARDRGDNDGARQLLTAFEDQQELASGALLVAELTLRMLQQQTGEPMDGCVRDLCLRLDEALAG